MNFPRLKTMNFHRSKIMLTLAGCLLSGLVSSANAAEYNLAVQPLLPPEETRLIYEPLLEYLTEETGHTFNLVTNINYVSHWLKARDGEYDLLLDAPHFTAYRVLNLDYHIIAKVKDTVSFSLVGAPESQFFSANELVGRRVVTTSPPSLSALTLQGLYPNPVREPRFVTVNSVEDAVQQVLDGKAVAALVPTPVAGQHPELNVIQVTKPFPHMALSAAPSIPERIRAEIAAALINASNTEHGKDVLSQIRIAGFETADFEDYRPYASLLTEGRNFQHASYRR